MTEVPKLHVLVRELAFWGNFIIVLKRIWARSLKNTLKLSKNVIRRSKTTFFYKDAFKDKKSLFFLEGFALIRARAGPIRAHMGPHGPLWAHIWAHMGPFGPIYGPIWAPMGPYGPIWAFLDRSWRSWKIPYTFRKLSVETFGPISHVSGPKLVFWWNF